MHFLEEKCRENISFYHRLNSELIFSTNSTANTKFHHILNYFIYYISFKILHFSSSFIQKICVFTVVSVIHCNIIFGFSNMKHK